MLQRFEASIFMLGWGVPTFDALYSLQSLVRSVGAQGDGNFNVGRFSNPQMDALVERIKKEGDPKSRAALIDQALMLSRREITHLPLHHQVIPWAMKKNIDMHHRADNRIDMQDVKVN
jgi:peptide/nickel transport system substrate-binding protein